MTVDATAFLAALKPGPDGLVAAIAQDRSSGGVRMLGWANALAITRTAETGLAHFWSRSRGKLWQKGEESGHTLQVRELRLDCDGDAVLYVCDPVGPTCHTGRTSCFFRLATESGLREDDGAPPPAAAIVPRVAEVIGERRRARPERSYVVALLDAGYGKIGEKILEEARELVEALPEGDRSHTAHEAADLLFHALVGLEAAGVPVSDVFAELQRRFGTSGLDEKARRPSSQ